MGVGFAYSFVKIFLGPKVIAYTHYPMMRYFNNPDEIYSYDMIEVVASG